MAKTRWHELVIDHYRGGAEKWVLVVIARHADWDTGVAEYLSVQTIADKAGVSKRTAQRYIRKLEDGGVLNVAPRYRKGQQTGNRYVLLWAGITGAEEIVAEIDGIGAEIDTPAVTQGTPLGVTEPCHTVPCSYPSNPPSGAVLRPQETAGASVCGTLTSSAGFTIGTEGLDGFLSVLGGNPKQVQSAWNRALQGGAHPDVLIYAARRYASEKPAAVRKAPHAFLDERVWQDYEPKPRKEAARDCPACGGVGFVEDADGGAYPCQNCTPQIAVHNQTG